MALHRTKHRYLISALHSVGDRRAWTRSWYVRGILVGSWKSRSGKVYAIGHTAGGEVVIYNPRVCLPKHGWQSTAQFTGEEDVAWGRLPA